MPYGKKERVQDKNEVWVKCLKISLKGVLYVGKGIFCKRSITSLITVAFSSLGLFSGGE